MIPKLATCRDDQQQSLSTATGETSLLADLLQPEAMHRIRWLWVENEVFYNIYLGAFWES